MNVPSSAYKRAVSGLSADTRTLLARGAWYWSDVGPAGVDDQLALLMNFEDREAVGAHLRQLAQALRADEPVSVLDLTRVLLLTEIGFVSIVVGPCDWESVFYGADYDTWDAAEFAAVRRAQDELQRAGVPASGTDPFGKHPLPG